MAKMRKVNTFDCSTGFVILADCSMAACAAQHPTVAMPHSCLADISQQSSAHAGGYVTHVTTFTPQFLLTADLR